jgi:hypothetical protein
MAENARPPMDIVNMACVRPWVRNPRGLENGIENRSGFDRVIHLCIATLTCVTRDRVPADAASPQQRFRAPIAQPDRALIAYSRSLDKPCQCGHPPYLDRSRRIAHRFANPDRERSGSSRNDRPDPVRIPCDTLPSLTRRAFKTAHSSGLSRGSRPR